MARTLAHRGPDDEQVEVHGPAGLGFRRLAIIDPNGGRQPLTDESGRIHLVGNGEIYNFRSLRKGLEERHRFAGGSDFETVVHAYDG
jgi:asparagine synthase (glutamine-hydrolysing)